MTIKPKTKNLFLILIYLVRHPARFFRALFGTLPRLSLGKIIRWCWATLPRRIVSTILIALFIIAPIQFLLFKKEAKAAWWNDSWQYRQKIQLTNSTGADLTDFQVSTTVDTAALITAGKMITTTCADMRFTDSKGQQLDYWIEENNPGCNSATTKVWLKAPKVYAGTNATSIYMYYGNPSATATQSGDKVFEFFDDFNGSSLNTNKWPQHSGESVGSGNLTLVATSANQAGSEDYVYAANTNVTLGSVVEIRNKSAATNVENRFGLTDQRTTFYLAGANYVGFQKWTDSNLYSDTNNGGAITQTSEKAYDTNWHSYKMFWTTNSVKYYEDSTLLRTYVTNVPDGADNLHPLLRDRSQTDYIFTHKYASADPTASASAEEIGPGPIAYWKFDEGQGGTAYNSTSQTGINGTLQNSPTWKPESDCVGGKCLQYNGTNQYVSVDDTGTALDFVNTNQYTWSAWVNTSGFPSGRTQQCFLSKDFGVAVSKVNGFNLCLNQTGGTADPVICRGSSTAGQLDCSSGLSLGLTSNKWYHVEISYDGASNWKTYVDGNYKGSQSLSVTSDTTYKYFIGAGVSSTTDGVQTGLYFFQGKIDSVKIFPYQRSSDQVKQDYNSGKAGNSSAEGANVTIGESPKWMTDGLVGHWKMDEASGASVADASGNGNTGTLTNAQETGTGNSAGTTTVMEDDANASLATTNDAYNGMILHITGGGGCGIATDTERTITDYIYTVNESGTIRQIITAAFSAETDSCTYEIRHQAGGKFGNGVGFDGVNDYITAGTAPSMNITGAITIATWLKVDSFTKVWQAIVTKGDSSWRLHRYSSNNTVAFGTTGLSQVDLQSTSSINDGNWHYVVAIYGGSADPKKYIYIDGKLDASTPATGNISTNAYNVAIGENLQVLSRQFDGTIDDTRIYNRALSPDEVKQLSEWGPGPIAHYSFDEGTGGTVYDKSGDGHNGTWGGTGTRWANGKYGNAGSFNGSNDVVTMDNSSSWFYMPQAFTTSFFISRDSDARTYVDVLGCLPSNDLALRYFKVSFVNNDMQVSLADGTNYTENSFQPNLTPNVFSHISITRDASNTLRVYKDGVQIGSATNTRQMPHTTTAFKIGYTSWDEFDGLLDDVRVYNYARSSKQIVEDMNAGHPIGGSPVGSPVAYWKLDEGYGSTSQDSSQNNQDLTLSSSAWTGNGKFGRGLDLEKDYSEYAYAADSAALSITSDLTISAWIKPESNSVGMLYNIANKWDGTNQSYSLVQVGNELRMHIDASGNYKMTSGLGLQTGQWYYVSGVYSASAQTVTLYVNGVDKGGSVTGTIPASIGDDAGRFHIGAESSTGKAANYYDGIIDEVKVYNSALSAEQIKLDMNQGKELQLGGQVSATGATGQAAEYCVPGSSDSCAGPTGEWKFDEGSGGSVNDTSGNSSLGTWNGTGAHWTVDGKKNNAGKFNGSDDFVSMADVPTFAGNIVTESVWFYRKTNTSDYECIVSIGHGSANFGAYSICSMANGKIRAHAQENYLTSISSDNAVSNNVWHHAAMVSNGTNYYLYIDGVRQTAVGTTGTPNADFFRIGKSMTASEYFDGQIDQVQIFNYARTPAQIAWDFNRGKPVGWWRMDEGEGGSAYDSSGNGNTGTMTLMDPPNDWVAGKFGRALDFAGDDDYVATGNAAIVAPNSQTYNKVSWGGWINPAGSGTMLTSIHKNNEFKLSNAAFGRPFCTIYSGGSWQSGTVYWLTPPAGSWTHIMCVYDGSTIKVFYNGTEKASQAETDNITSTNSTALNIGRDSAGSGYCQGQIDDVRVYNYALTAEQVKQVMNEGSVVRFGD